MSTVHSVLKTAHGHSISKSHGERESKGNGSGSGSSGTTARWRTRTRTWTFVVSVSDKRALRAATASSLQKFADEKEWNTKKFEQKIKGRLCFGPSRCCCPRCCCCSSCWKKTFCVLQIIRSRPNYPLRVSLGTRRHSSRVFSRRLRKLCQTSFWHFFKSFHFWWGFEICLYRPFEPFVLRIQHATMCFSLQ